MHFFIRCTVPPKKELACEEGPYVYQEWLGEDTVEHWEEVKRCIAIKGCKPGGIKSYIKSIYFRSGKNSIDKKFESHVNCTNWSIDTHVVLLFNTITYVLLYYLDVN